MYNCYTQITSSIVNYIPVKDLYKFCETIINTVTKILLSAKFFLNISCIRSFIKNTSRYFSFFNKFICG